MTTCGTAGACRWPSITPGFWPTPIDRARAKLEYTSLATTFLDDPFTIADLRRVYETVWGVRLHAANFRRKVLSTPGFVVSTGEVRGRGRAELYRRGTVARLHPAILRPTSERGTSEAEAKPYQHRAREAQLPALSYRRSPRRKTTRAITTQ